MTRKTAIFWFRQDLRLTDNTALLAAAEAGHQILPVFILDDEAAGEWKRGGASRWWLHQSLSALNKSLSGRLVFRKGVALPILKKLIEDSGAEAVFWNRCYEPWRIARDKEIKAALKDDDIDVQTFKDYLLWEPWEALKDDGKPYQVFTPFFRRGCLGRGMPDMPQEKPKKIHYTADAFKTGALDDLALMPDIPWYKDMAKTWTPGEAGAQQRLTDFINGGLKGYATGRDRPDRENVSRLSPHLHFGEISPRQAWHNVRMAAAAEGVEQDAEKFSAELGWREFSYNLLYHAPDIPRQPLQKRFTRFPWRKDDEALKRWQKGQTGIPIVDAGMRQLWQTGWMHNRVRMIVASLLIKNLLIHWHEGENWFWDCLVDADLANNSASWQWVAGCGADAAPYFRIFNPVTQSEKFDPNGDYIREFVPELAKIPAKYIHAPWDAPDDVLKAAGVTIGKTYPEPIADLKKSRERALEAFDKIRSAA